MLPLLFAWIVGVQTPHPGPVDVRRLEIGAPIAVVELDRAQLKGDIRRFAWSPDGQRFYVQTAEGTPPKQVVRHYTISRLDGRVSAVDAEPDWADAYWSHKQDVSAPGNPTLKIAALQGTEVIKSGPGPAGVLDRTSSPDAVAHANRSVESLASGTMGTQKAVVVQLALLGEPIATWVNERPLPGSRFSWGPKASDALVYLGEKGQLVFFDASKHRRTVARTKDGTFPAWSEDGTNVAYLQKVGRRKLTVMVMPVGW
jgi:hypothetical protein